MTGHTEAIPSLGLSGPPRREGAFARLKYLLLTREPRQQIRLLQAGLANVLMLASVAAMHVLDAYGIADHRWVWPWTIASVGGLAALFALIRSGRVQHWRDPALTLPHMLYAVLTAAAGYCIAGASHSVVLPILAVVMMFGMFGLTPHHVRIVGAWTLALFGAGGLYWIYGAARHADPGAEIVRMMMIVIIVVGVERLTTRLYGMRERMRKQREQLTSALERIRELATRDELTGCLNRRAMQEHLAQESERSARLNMPMCLVLLDLDHFKRVNDQHGHAAGDRVLQGFANLARGQLRAYDLLARWGGEEFLLLLPATAAEQGRVVVQRLLAQLEAIRMDGPAGERLAVTASAGLMECSGSECVSEALECVDQALYRAKGAGRNRVETGVAKARESADESSKIGSSRAPDPVVGRGPRSGWKFGPSSIAASASRIAGAIAWPRIAWPG